MKWFYSCDDESHDVYVTDDVTLAQAHEAGHIGAKVLRDDTDRPERISRAPVVRPE